MVVVAVVLATRTTGELNNQTLAHKVGSIYAGWVSTDSRVRHGRESSNVRKAVAVALALVATIKMGRRLTRNDVSRIHGILVLDEAEAIHELDLGDLASAMGSEVAFNIGLGGCRHRGC